jgi:hypothetical protein
MLLAEHDHVVQKLSPYASNEALGCPVLPRALERGPLRSDPDRLDRAGNLAREDRVVVEDQEAMPRLVGEGLAKLLANPRGRRMPGVRLK